MQSENAQVRIGTVLLDLLIPCTAFYVFSRLGKASVLDKFLCNCIQAMCRTMKVQHCELLVKYGFLKLAVQESLLKVFYNEDPPAVLVEVIIDTTRTPVCIWTSAWKWRSYNTYKGQEMQDI